MLECVDRSVCFVVDKLKNAVAEIYYLDIAYCSINYVDVVFRGLYYVWYENEHDHNQAE